MTMKIKFLFCLFFFCLLGGRLAFAQKKAVTCEGYEMTSEGAWCWFADPRALHYENKAGSINKTYVGYIDIHGDIKAMQYDFLAHKQDTVLIRSHFQKDDHNNPTFLVLPDERIMIFYSKHTSEPCFYYRISLRPGDITVLGEEKILKTENNTTYPSPFILSDDPEHIYLCWRGIGWHPTIAKLSLPDKNDNVHFAWGPYQMVKSTGARPYAKYLSNGKNKIFMAYTTGHPDNESPNFLYFNYINIQTMQLEDVKGNKLSFISDEPFQIDKTDECLKNYPYTVVDHPKERDWVWQIAADKQGNPIIALARISTDKTEHSYHYAHWTGKEWNIQFLSHAGGHFHQTPDREMCYSGGMTIDPENTNIVYCSVPIEGENGKKYEIIKYTLNNEGNISTVDAITCNSHNNNVRPYIIPNSGNTPLRLAWLNGNYYYWAVNDKYPKGYCTAIHCNFEGFATEK